eukprot:g8976.t1
MIKSALQSCIDFQAQKWNRNKCSKCLQWREAHSLDAEFGAAAESIRPSASDAIHPKAENSSLKPRKSLLPLENKHRSGLLALPPQLWRRILDSAGLGVRFFVACLGRVCKQLYSLRLQPSAWPSVLDLRFARGAVPDSLLELWWEWTVSTRSAHQTDQVQSMPDGHKLGFHTVTLNAKQVSKIGALRASLRSMPVLRLQLRAGWKTDVSEVTSLAASLPHLSRLDVYGGYGPNDDSLQELSKLRLNHLHLGGAISDQGLSYLQDMPLQHLSLWGCKAITDSGLRSLSRLPLQHLSLWGKGCQTITDAGLLHLAPVPLHHLSLEDCAHFTDAGLTNLLSKGFLRIESFDNLTDAGLQHICRIKSLQYLIIAADITDQGLASLAESPLCYLDLVDCPNLTPVGVQSFKHQQQQPCYVDKPESELSDTDDELLDTDNED